MTSILQQAPEFDSTWTHTHISRRPTTRHEPVDTFTEVHREWQQVHRCNHANSLTTTESKLKAHVCTSAGRIPDFSKNIALEWLWLQDNDLEGVWCSF